MGYSEQLHALPEDWVLDLDQQSVLLVLSEAEMIAAQFDAVDAGSMPILLHTLPSDADIPTQALANASGKPVEVLGDRLRLHDLTVEVTDGCSGVRSFQSFVMATWFFAELQRLRVMPTLVLLVSCR